MILREGEKILKTYRHHPTPFILGMSKVIAGALPFFILIYFAKDSMSGGAFFGLHALLFLIFTLVLTYRALVYWLDRLIVTNHRIVHVDWKYLTIRNEYEADLIDIQDIITKEKGFLSAFWFFDYGEFRLETASNRSIIVFENAPDPEGLRQMVYKLKPNS